MRISRTTNYSRSLLACLIISSALMAACGGRPSVSPTLTISPTPTRSSVAAKPTVTIHSPLPTPTVLVPAGTPTAGPLTGCRIGTHLREETVQTVLRYKDQPAVIMAPSYELAEIYFPQLAGWMRVLGAPSLAELEEKAEKASQGGVPFEALGYGLETGDKTPEAEWQDLVGSTRKAQAIADRYGKLLVMGPGFRLMSRNEDKYAPMAALSDVWVLQTQVLQATSPGDAYREDVERLVGLLRSGNPNIQIWAQITLLPDRPPSAEEWLAFRGAIDDLVEGTYLGIYLWNLEDPDVLIGVAEEVYAGACGGGHGGTPTDVQVSPQVYGESGMKSSLGGLS